MKSIETEHFTFVHSTKAKLPSLAFVRMKDAVLGPTYDLTVAIVDTKTIHDLNLKHRGIDAPTDILSFPLTDMSGEIYINLEEAKKEAPKFNREYENFLAFLFIHGLVHLEGYDHGSRMEEIEQKWRNVFGV